MSTTDYKAAYLRQKKARELADKLLEDKTRELHEANTTLTAAYYQLKHQKLQISHQEKLASLGQLSAGVAHEINNPSAYIRSNLNSLNKYRVTISEFLGDIEQLLKDSPLASDFSELKRANDMDFVLEDINEIVTDAIGGMDKIADIVRSLKDFSRPDAAEKKPFNVNENIKNTLKLVWNEIKYKADIELSYGEVPDVSGYSGGFSQVILNLLMNAAQAIEQRGKITVSTEYRNRQVCIKISDTGKGISPENLVRIFDPFFSTKAPGKGTGLGLSISHGIIKKHGGNLTATSVLGEGTTFTIVLPVE